MSKNLKTSSLVEFWYKNSYALHYLNEFIQSSKLQISQSVLTTTAEYNKMNSELEAIIRGSDEFSKLEKIRRNINYRKPEDIFEAISDCYRYAKEFKSLLIRKKYRYVYKQIHIDTTNNFIILLKETYKSAAIGTNKFIPKWVKK